MDKNTIKKYLKMIGIESIDQLNQNSIDYWWKRKKIEVKSSYNSKTEIKENQLLIGIFDLNLYIFLKYLKIVIYNLQIFRHLILYLYI